MINWTKLFEHSIPSLGDDGRSIYMSALKYYALSKNKPFYTYALRLVGEIPANELTILDVGLDAQLLLSRETNSHQLFELVYGWEEGVVRFEIEKDGADSEFVQMTVYTTETKDYEKIFSKFQRWEYIPSEGDNRGHIYVLTQNDRGLTYSSVGIAKTPLVEENYERSVVEDTKIVIESLKSEMPSGRIVLIRGEPGTGKTYLIRSILDSVKKATFIIITPSLVESLTGPNLMTFFIQNSEDFVGPVVLVIEDADPCLVERSLDNMSLVSSLLNVSDGIIGNLLDFRIIATTNANMKNIDKAILRPGRLLKKIDITKLSINKSESIYKRLSGKELVFTAPATLAEIYQLAIGSGEIKREERPRAGFIVSPENIRAYSQRVSAAEDSL